jgi:hypothetical protein
MPPPVLYFTRPQRQGSLIQPLVDHRLSCVAWKTLLLRTPVHRWGNRGLLESSTGIPSMSCLGCQGLRGGSAMSLGGRDPQCHWAHLVPGSRPGAGPLVGPVCGGRVAKGEGLTWQPQGSSGCRCQTAFAGGRLEALLIYLLLTHSPRSAPACSLLELSGSIPEYPATVLCAS